MSLSDHFSGVASGYAKHRPRYPEALFDWLAGAAPGRGAAWDAGTGNGQAAVALAERFARVVATDASAEQIANAAPHPRVTYRVAPGEDGPGEPGPFDLVTVAQALHWLDVARFAHAVRAAARDGALVCAFSYGPVRTDDAALNALLLEFDRALHAGSWWPPERRLVDEEYRTIPFPFDRVAAPSFAMETAWDAAAFLAYVDTWSGVARLKAAGKEALLDSFREGILRAWGEPAAPRPVRWPLAVLAGRV